jgi:hypothetical protein
MRKVQNLAKASFPLPDVVTAPVPAPTEGWDAISPLAAMDPKRAPILQNWVPRPGWVELRAGYQPFCLMSASTPVESLIVWRGPSSQRMFAANNARLYEVTSQTPVQVAAGPYASNRWQYTQFAPAGGDTYLQLVNGVDALQMYDGTTSTWSVPSITGLPNSWSSSNIINIYAQKRRLWYVMAQSTIVAYMPTDTIMGAIAGYIDFGALWTKGGYAVAMGDWTEDGGNGPQDYAVFISSRGQASIYAGTDPTNAATWSLVGTFDLSPPLGYRCLTRLGSDLGVITLQGLLPLSQALPFDPSADRSSALTSRIQNAMAAASATSQNNFGWELVSFPAQQLFLLNVPLTQSVQQDQFVMNALTGAWCHFVGWNANTFALFNDNLYFGDNNGVVQQAYTSGLDGFNSILADMQCAFNWFDDPGRTKRMTAVQPLVAASGVVSPILSVDADFSDNAPAAPVTVITGGAEWDSAIWDQSLWPEPVTIQTSWYSTQVLGHALAVRMQANVASTTSTNIVEGEFDFSVFDTAQFDGQFNPGLPATLQVNAFNAILELGGFI